jgi:hypothetical protein
MTHSLNSLSSNAVRVAESSLFAFVTARTRIFDSAAGSKHLTGPTSLSMSCLVATLRSKSIEACKRTPARLGFGFL